MARRSERSPAVFAAGPPVHARILVAEDNRVNQQVAAAMIERLGPRVDVAGNGKEVIPAPLQKLCPVNLGLPQAEALIVKAVRTATVPHRGLVGQLRGGAPLRSRAPSR